MFWTSYVAPLHHYRPHLSSRPEPTNSHAKLLLHQASSCRFVSLFSPIETLCIVRDDCKLIVMLPFCVLGALTPDARRLPCTRHGQIGGRGLRAVREQDCPDGESLLLERSRPRLAPELLVRAELLEGTGKVFRPYGAVGVVYSQPLGLSLIASILSIAFITRVPTDFPWALPSGF